MRVAILHFHLRPGGVTRVIEMACAALEQHGLDPLVISGEPVPAGCRLKKEQVAVVEELAYDIGSGKREALRLKVDAAMQQRWGTLADVLHLHNHALGKNFALPGVAADWAKEGRALVLQIHDFAENGRPGNYRRLLGELGGSEGLDRVLYPTAPRVAYAVLNSADRTRLRQAGFPDSVILPNPVSLPGGGEAIKAADFGAERIIVYPTRAIRRKNIGEAILLATQLSPGEKILLTAAPERGEDVVRHVEWRRLAEDLRLPVLFDVQGETGRPTVDFLRGADLCLTTSVAEGFGMAFLEPWLADRAVTGRDLRSSTEDFRLTGLALEGLYERLEVPVEDRAVVEERIGRKVAEVCVAYGVAEEAEYCRLATEAVFKGQTADFGRLDEEAQSEVIRRAASGQVKVPFPEVITRDIPINREVVEREFSLEKYGEKLRLLYDSVTEAAGEASGRLDAGKVLSANLNFEDFHLLMA